MSKMAKVKSCRGCPGFQDCGTAYINGDGFYKTHPNCPLPDYVDVSKLKETIAELERQNKAFQDQYNRSGDIITKLQKERDELVKVVYNIFMFCDGSDNISTRAIATVAGEALAKIKEGADIIMCGECGQYPADLPSELCCGCDAYKEHY